MTPDDTLNTITQLLDRWTDGDEEALARLMPLVQDRLGRVAASYLRREREGHTFQTVDLVNEAYLRLVDQNRVKWKSRAHFYGIAAQMMRRILINHAQKYLYEKRGGGVRPLGLEEALSFSVEQAPELVALDDALNELATMDPRQARIVELRYFAGMTSEEIAEVLGISVPTVTRGMRAAKAWLYKTLKNEDAS